MIKHGWNRFKWVILVSGSFILAHFFQYLFPITRFGIVPRNTDGLIGVLTSPWLHRDFNHLFMNLSGFIPLALLFYWVHPRQDKAVMIGIWITSGLLTWCIGRDGVHIGASGWIFGLFGFLVVAGFYLKSVKVFLISLGVAFLYGGMIYGMVPVEGPVSWEGHLAGFLSGFIWARASKKGGVGRAS